MSRDEVRREVIRFLGDRPGADAAKLAALADEHSLFEQLGIDSVTFLELLVHLAGRTGSAFDLTDVDPSRLAVLGTLLDQFGGPGERP